MHILTKAQVKKKKKGKKTIKFIFIVTIFTLAANPHAKMHVGLQIFSISESSGVQTLTLLQHPCLPTLAQAALLALAAHVHVHFTAPVVLAGVLGTFNDAAPKKALAALAAQHIVVETGGLVATDAAHLVAQHLWSRPLLPFHWLTVYTK